MGFFDKIDRARRAGQPEKQPRECLATPIISVKIDKRDNNPPAAHTAEPQDSAGIDPSNTRHREDRDQAQAITAAPPHRRTNHDSPESFNKSWPWLKENLSSLFAAGWTRRALFQKSANRYPAGQWGVAWLDVWRKPGLVAKLTATGNIEFSFSSGSRQVRQTATRPPARDNSPAPSNSKTQ